MLVLVMPNEGSVHTSFSGSITPVAPDSGRTRELIVAFPGEMLPRGADVPAGLGVHDGVVDSVEVLSAAGGSQIRVAFRDSVRFQVSPVPADADKPFRVVIVAIRREFAA